MERSEMKAVINLLDNINLSIEAMLKAILTDFSQITQLIKNPIRQAKHNNTNSTQALGPVIKELQNYDILRQKLEHIKRIHHWIQDDILQNKYNGMTDASSVSVLRLNHLQFSASYVDYQSSVNHIQLALDKNYTYRTLGLSEMTEIFAHSGMALTASQQVSSGFLEAEKLCRGWSAVDLYLRLGTIQDLYSTESERNILHAYMNKPDIGENEIQLCSLVSENDASDIDLF